MYFVHLVFLTIVVPKLSKSKTKGGTVCTWAPQAWGGGGGGGMQSVSLQKIHHIHRVTFPDVKCKNIEKRL